MTSNSDAGIYRTTLKKKNSKRIDYFAYTLALLYPPTNLCMRGEIPLT